MFDITLTSDSTGEPRIEDLTLASMLGFEHPRRIRSLIERHADTLSRLGTLCTTVVQTGGRPATVTWLTERQALYLCTKSETPNAVDITIAIVEAFVAWRRGEAPVNADPRLSAAVRELATATGGTVRSIWHRMMTAHGISDPHTITKAQAAKCLAWLRDATGYRNVTPEIWHRRWAIPGYEAEAEHLHAVVALAAQRHGRTLTWWYKNFASPEYPWSPYTPEALRAAIVSMEECIGLRIPLAA